MNSDGLGGTENSSPVCCYFWLFACLVVHLNKRHQSPMGFFADRQSVRRAFPFNGASRMPVGFIGL